MKWKCLKKILHLLTKWIDNAQSGTWTKKIKEIKTDYSQEKSCPYNIPLLSE